MNNTPTRIGFVTTYPPMPCAIGIYSQKLMRAAVKSHNELRFEVITENVTESIHETSISSHPTYCRNSNYHDAILHAAQEKKVQILHFQYAPDLLGRDERLPNLLKSLRKAGIRSVVTFHTVYADGLWARILPGMAPAEFHRAVSRETDRIVVHHRHGMADLLISQGVDYKKIAVIPHGTDLLPELDMNESRRLLGLPEEIFLFTFFGFIHIQKNVHTAVNAFIHVSRELPQASLLVAGKAWGDRPYNFAYIRLLKARKFLSGLGERIVFMDHYIPTNQVPNIFAASDVLLLPHWQKYGSASGVFHQAIGAKKPILVAKGPKFEDGLKRLQSLPALTPDALRASQWKDGMRALYHDEALRNQARNILSDYAQETAWPCVAESTYALYKELLP